MARFDRIDDHLNYRMAKPEDVAPLLDVYGDQFFAETGYGDYAEFDLERAKLKMAAQLRSGLTQGVVVSLNGVDIGFGAYVVDHIFTVKPLAYLWIIFVAPIYRRSPVGRTLMTMLVAQARLLDGATAFFATVPPTTPSGRRLCNLLCHMGFAPMAGAFIREL